MQDRISVDFALAVGQTSTTIAVEAQAEILDRETSSLGQVVEES